MSSNNQYILTSHKRKKVRLKIIRILFVMALLYVLSPLVSDYFCINIKIFIYLIVLLLIYCTVLIILYFSEKNSIRLYGIFLITFFICLIFSLSVNIIFSFMEIYGKNGEISINNEIKKCFIMVGFFLFIHF